MKNLSIEYTINLMNNKMWIQKLATCHTFDNNEVFGKGKKKKQ